MKIGLEICAHVNCLVVPVSSITGSQSTKLLKRTISVEVEEDILLDLELGASGVDKGLRRCGDGGDQEGQELRWYYVRLKSATPPHGRISPAGRTTRLQVVRYNENPPGSFRRTQSLCLLFK